MSTTGLADAAWFAPQLDAATRELLAPAVLALATATDPRNRLPGQGSLSGAFDPAGLRMMKARLTRSPDLERSPDRAVATLARSSRVRLARALARSEGMAAKWPERTLEDAPIFGPDLRSGRHSWFVTVDGIVGVSGTQPLGVEGGPSFGWFAALGADAWDFVDVYGFYELAGRHPLGSETPFAREGTARVGYGARLNPLRFHPARLFAGSQT